MKNGVRDLAARFESGNANNASSSSQVDTSIDAALARADSNRVLFRFGTETPAERQVRLAAEQAAQEAAMEAANQAVILALLAEDRLEHDLAFARQLEEDEALARQLSM